MFELIACPNCNQDIDPHARVCSNCGIDLAIAAAIAQAQIDEGVEIRADALPVRPEVLVPRLGDYLVENGLVDTVGLEKALAYQRQHSQEGQPMLLGQALVDLKILNQSALDQAVTMQIAHLQEALRASNAELEERVQERTMELQAALRKVTQLNQLKTNFISNISHELRTPLAHLIGYLDLLKDEAFGPITEGQGNALGVMFKAYQRLQSLIDNLIQFSLLSEGELSLKTDKVEVDEIIKEAIAYAQTTAAAQEIELKYKIPKDAITIDIDIQKIVWVLQQLLDNAIKFNNPGGAVYLHTELQNGMLKFIVRDTGIGIPTDQIEEIFEPFHQLDGSATRRYGGTGLGLALAQKILEAHGSKLAVSSVVDKGSTFEFSLPTV